MELLSPAGNFEALKTAVKCGADAVYLGGKSFSARKNAENFSDEELIKAIDFCHLHKVKAYVAINISLKEAEVLPAFSFATHLLNLGVDGIIVQDLGLLTMIRSVCDDVKLNASTQMTVCSSDGVNLLEELGANRVVLARELSENEISSIRKKTDAELEVFVHGALCMSYSGQCLLSSVIGGRSGNRGLCAQPCRLSYTLLKDGKPVTKQMPLLCMKDLCLAEETARLTQIADSAKIEGRMKSAFYAGVVTDVYKKAFDGDLDKDAISTMLSAFSRGGSCTGYFHGRSFSKMMDYESGEKVTAQKGEIAAQERKDRAKKREISFVLTAQEGEPLSLAATCDGFSESAVGDVAETAQNAALDEKRAETSLQKLGDTPFVLKEINLIKKGNPFAPASALNALRRKVCEGLERQICDSFRRNIKNGDIPPEVVPRETKIPRLAVEVRTKEQLDAAREMGMNELYLAESLLQEVEHDNATLLLPSVTKEGETLNVNQAASVLVQNIGQIRAVTKKTMLGGERLNVTNSKTASVLKSLGFSRVTLSTELNLKEIRELTKKTSVPTELIVYGRIPVMLLENCVIKSAYGCRNGKGNFALKDRMGEIFPILCENCRNVLLNSVPIYMADKMDDILTTNAEVLRLKFTTETGEECKKVIRAYKDALNGKKPEKVFDKITRGHFYRGVE